MSQFLKLQSLNYAVKTWPTVLFVSLQLLSVSSSKHQRDSTGSKEEESHVFGLLEHTMTAIEKFLARKRKKLKPSAATSCNTAPLEVVNEHPVLMSTLALLLHNNPQLISERYISLHAR